MFSEMYLVVQLTNYLPLDVVYFYIIQSPLFQAKERSVLKYLSTNNRFFRFLLEILFHFYLLRK